MDRMEEQAIDQGHIGKNKDLFSGRDRLGAPDTNQDD